MVTQAIKLQTVYQSEDEADDELSFLHKGKTQTQLFSAYQHLAVFKYFKGLASFRLPSWASLKPLAGFRDLAPLQSFWLSTFGRKQTRVLEGPK